MFLPEYKQNLFTVNRPLPSFFPDTARGVKERRARNYGDDVTGPREKIHIPLKKFYFYPILLT
jgi:hypothetical protein